MILAITILLLLLFIYFFFLTLLSPTLVIKRYLVMQRLVGWYLASSCSYRMWCLSNRSEKKKRMFNSVKIKGKKEKKKKKWKLERYRYYDFTFYRFCVVKNKWIKLQQSIAVRTIFFLLDLFTTNELFRLHLLNRCQSSRSRICFDEAYRPPVPSKWLNNF